MSFALVHLEPALLHGVLGAEVAEDRLWDRHHQRGVVILRDATQHLHRGNSYNPPLQMVMTPRRANKLIPNDQIKEF